MNTQVHHSPATRRHTERRHTTPLLILSGVVLIAAAACANTVPDKLPQRGVVVPPADKSVFLRASFDDDPSSFVGRFLPDSLEAGEIDENQAMSTRCSEFISYKEIKAGGSYDEYYNSARQASLSVSLPGVAAAEAGAGNNATVRVRYDLTRKMRAEIEDQAGFDQCCTADPAQCPEFIIGEFFYGTGEVFQAAGAQAGLGGSGTTPSMVTGEMEFKDQVAWKRQTRFEDVYFAFRKQRVRNNAVAAADTECGWANNVPTSLDGQYFVGISAPAASEAAARDMAMRNARAQAVRYLGEFITSASATTSSAMEGYLQDEKVVTAVAEGLASRVKDRKWCAPETTETPKGNMVSIKVLAFFPKEEEAAAAREAVDKVEDALKTEGRLDDNARDRLSKVREALK